jgi:hypothetical protein
MKLKRRNLTPWMENRLRRLDHKLSRSDNPSPTDSAYQDFSPVSIERCRVRGYQLACAIQIEWGKRHAQKMR